VREAAGPVILVKGDLLLDRAPENIVGLWWLDQLSHENPKAGQSAYEAKQNFTVESIRGFLPLQRLFRTET